jgi:hypothetical protein
MSFAEPEECCYGRDPRVITLPRYKDAADTGRLPHRAVVNYRGGQADVIILDGYAEGGHRVVVAYAPSQRVLVAY